MSIPQQSIQITSRLFHFVPENLGFSWRHPVVSKSNGISSCLVPALMNFPAYCFVVPWSLLGELEIANDCLSAFLSELDQKFHCERVRTLAGQYGLCRWLAWILASGAAIYRIFCTRAHSRHGALDVIGVRWLATACNRQSKLVKSEQ